MPQFPITTQNIHDNYIIITDKPMLKHAVSVLRLKVNDELLLLDETEKTYKCCITEISKEQIKAKIIHAEQSNRKLNFRLDLLQCCLKSTAMDIVVQKMTELGTKNLYVMPSIRSVSKFSEHDAKSKIAKWQKIADESCKQCERADKPNIYYLENMQQLKEHSKQYDLIVACVERSSGQTLKEALKNSLKPQKVLVIIGPEGGFEDKEIKFFENNNYTTVSISNLIYRAETAAISALSGVIYEYEL